MLGASGGLHSGLGFASNYVMGVDKKLHPLNCIFPKCKIIGLN